MKKLALFLLLACAQLASAQTPQAISYQAIARDANGKPMPEEDISVEFSVLDGSMSGQAVYRERHETETNPFGLFTLEIGRGTVLGGSFSGIDWGGGPKFMRVEINGTLQGTTQLLSVPYALFAEKTKSSQSLDLPGAQQGQVLKWDATAQKWLPANDEVGPPNSGLTSVATAAPISGDGTTGNPVTLAAGSIGSGQIADGSVQAADLAPGVIPTVPASLPPSGAAGGDLSGNYPGPTVAKIQGRNVDAAAPTSGQVLKWDGSKWTPQNDIGGGAGDGWGSQTAKTDATLAGDGTTTNPLKLAPQGAANGQFLKWNGATWLPSDVTVAVANNSITTNQIVDNSITINDLAPGVIPTTLLPSGAAGGDLSGNYPTPTVAKIQGKNVANTAPTNGQVLQFNGTAQRWEPTTQAGGGTSWGLAGNAGTDPAVNFIGTTDDEPIVFRVNGMNRMKITSEGFLEMTNPLYSIFIGESTGSNITTGQSNVAIGFSTFSSNTTGSQNIAIGREALYSNLTGLSNTAIGERALFSNTIGGINVAIGEDALFFNTTGNANTANGHKALYSNSAGGSNTANGSGALNSNTTGNYNTANGVHALTTNTIGSWNTAIGYFSGPNISFTSLSNTIAVGADTEVSASNTARIGNASVTSIGGQVNWTALSDQRIKTDVQENIPGLAFIQKLRPVSYRFDIHRQNELLGIVDTTIWEGKYDVEKIQFSGFLAQEVEQAAREVGYDFSGVDAPKNERSLYGLRYAEFTVPLVKAVQEQQQIIEAQRQQLELQGKLLAGLAARLEALEAAGRSEKVENR